MPHIVIEYSANLADRADIQSLTSLVHEAAIETGIFPVGGIRTRAQSCDIYQVADGHADNAFVHVCLRVGEGRPVEVRREAAQHIFSAAKVALDGAMRAGPLALSLDVVELDSRLSFKHNTIHEHLQRRLETETQ